MSRTRIATVLCLIFCIANLHATSMAQTPLVSMSGEQLLSLMQQGLGALKIPMPSGSQRNAMGMGKEPVQDCDGEDKDLTGAQLATNAAANCSTLSGLFSRINSEDGVIRSKLLGCWWDSQADRNSRNCQDLAHELLDQGNAEAAKVILSQAPGCHTQMNGDPYNQCFNFILAFPNAKQLFTGDELRAVAQESFARDQDLVAANYLRSVGVNVDDSAAQANSSQIQIDNAAHNQQVMDSLSQPNQAQINADARQAQLNQLRDAVTANGGLIQQAANQQTAAIRAIGDANAAQQQQAQANLASQQAEQQRQRAQQQAQQQQQAQMQAQQAAALRAMQQAAQQEASASSGGSAGAGAGAAHYVAPINAVCVSTFWNAQNYNWLSFMNSCGQPIHLTWIAINPADTFGAASADIAAGNFTNTGWSQAEVAQKQSFSLFTCPAGYIAVNNVSFQPVRTPGETFTCQKW